MDVIFVEREEFVLEALRVGVIVCAIFLEV